MRRWFLATAIVGAVGLMWWLACFGRVEGRTPLMQSALMGDSWAVRILLLAGADPNAVDIGGRMEGLTPLAHAVRGGNPAVVATLLAAGADANIGGDPMPNRLRKARAWRAEQRRPLCLAMATSSRGALEILELLLSHGARIEAPGFSALGCLQEPRGREVKAEYLLQRGADPNAVGTDGLPLLVHYAGRGFADVVRTLLENGADVNVADAEGRTALIVAATGAQADAVWVLLSHGADRTRRDRWQRTALDIARASSEGTSARAQEDYRKTAALLESASGY